MDEIFARLEVIERLLKIALSKPEFVSLIEQEKEAVYRDYGEQLDRLFPSSPEYEQARLPYARFNDVADEILGTMAFPRNEQ